MLSSSAEPSFLVLLLELADCMLLLDAEPLILALVGAGVFQFEHFARVVGSCSSVFLECLLEDGAAVGAL